MYLLGLDIGSSSIKAALLDAQTQQLIASATAPDQEMPMIASRPGWAEQHPDLWWDNVKIAIGLILTASDIDPADIAAIGISYQMHGLVVVDKNRQALRPSIIWCDSRAVEIGNEAAKAIGPAKCLKHLLNLPGNFTASKLRWVQENQPQIYDQIHKAMLPGDYVAMRLTDTIVTTESGLSEGILWDYQNHALADVLLNQYEIDPNLIPDTAPAFSVQGELSKSAAAELGLKPGVKVPYRAGDQPNNALSLNVLNPGEIAATAGTSGVVYGVGDQPQYDPKSRVNTFIHVNNTTSAPRYGVLMCLNGAGILNSWLKHNAAGGMDYKQMNEQAGRAPPGSDNLLIFPYGNGAERTLDNLDVGAMIHGLNFNRHNQSHLLRAGQEGIVFALNFGLEIMRDMGIKIETVRAGDANMFLSPLFGQVFADTTGAVVELFNTDGAQGAARGAGVGAGIYQTFPEAFAGLKRTGIVEPQAYQIKIYQEIYQNWRDKLTQWINQRF